ncbi:hypothetical protein GOB92_34375 [Sinorhizobium meliloti]|nr:hypothetical protein [Sinorhizobium meliloti]
MQSLLAKLKDPSLAINNALVGANWVVEASTGATFDVTNPSTGEVIATLPDLGRQETIRAIAS